MADKAPKKMKNEDLTAVENLRQAYANIKEQMHLAIVGQDEVIDQILISIFSRGHALLIGVPGIAKTLMIRTLAEIIDLKLNRIQCTPDLMPSDITGTEGIQEDKATGDRTFKFLPGPIFANVILA
ncbi:MAG: AAA family ATPase, partial [Planctomycetes bacterium]|nr:AAA family ATPase [Planctomycetota bacterium]